MTKSLEDALNLPPAIIDDTPLEFIENNLDGVEENLINARDIAKQAVDEIMNIAKQSQHPQAYQVLNTLVKTYADISMSQIDFELKKKRLERESGEKAGGDGHVVNQNLFVGSTAELMQMLEDLKKKDADQ